MFDDIQRGVVQQMEGHSGTDVSVVLIATLKVFDVGCQMGVDEAEAGVVENKPNSNTSFVPLKHQLKGLFRLMKGRWLLNYKEAK